LDPHYQTMASNNIFDYLNIEEETTNSPTTKKNKKPQTTLKTPAERQQSKAKQTQNKPPQNKPQVHDDTGFVTVQSQSPKRDGPKRLNKEEYLIEKSKGNNPIQNIPESSPPQRGEYKTRGGKTRNPRKPTGGVEDVNAKSLNKPDFIPGGTKKYSLDKPPKSGGGGSGNSGGSGGANRGGYKGGNRGGYKGGNRGGYKGNNKRPFDRHSATGVDDAPKKMKLEVKIGEIQ